MIKEKAEYNPETNTYTVDQTTQNATQQKIVGYGKKSIQNTQQTKVL